MVCADDHLANPATASSLRGRPEPIVQYQPKARRVSPVPQNVPVVHSSAYLLRRSKPKEGDRPAVQSPRDNAVDPVEQNAVEWALGQADAYFDRVEADTDTKSAARVLVKNPAAQLTMKTMQVGHCDSRRAIKYLHTCRLVHHAWALTALCRLCLRLYRYGVA